MIKTSLHIIISISFILSSMGLWNGQHFCQGDYVKDFYFVSIGSCKIMSVSCGAEINLNIESDKSNCCKNFYEYQKLDQDQIIENFEFKKLYKPVKLTATPSDVFLLITRSSIIKLDVRNHSPPLIVRNTQSWLQTYLC